MIVQMLYYIRTILILIFGFTGKANCQPQEPNEYIMSKMSGTKENDVVLFACEKGHMLLGSSHVTCLSTGEWSSEWPSCGRK